MIKFCICAILIAAALVDSAPISGVRPTENFNHSVALDKNYALFWNYNDTHVTFEVHVKTRGYVGFGISDKGKMSPADVVMGWVKNGVTHFAVIILTLDLLNKLRCCNLFKCLANQVT